jgi:hypothetical protein
MQQQLRNKLIDELTHIPDHQISMIYNFVYSFRSGNIMKTNFLNNNIDHFVNVDQTINSYASLEEGYQAMANDKVQEQEANEWIFDECGECLSDYPEDWDGWNE